MRTCANCGKKISGKSSKMYCGGTCKTAAARSRKKAQTDETTNAITKAQMKDVNYIGNYSPDAKERLLRVHALLGKKAFDLALDAAFIAVFDIVELRVFD